ncbi:MAG: helix-hairpin-helix domain-containing protein [Anaerolineae bacterium]|nr:helix-hairpin-helix domain-containing protein [Anaerolineae bacterium]
MKDETPIAEEIAQDEPSETPRIDINNASAQELTALPGIGAAMAARIVVYREEHGPFLLPEEISVVPGIGTASYERLAGRLKAIIPEELPISADDEKLEEFPLFPEPDIPKETDGDIALAEIEASEEVELAVEEEEVSIEDELPAEKIIAVEEMPVAKSEPQAEHSPPEPVPTPPSPTPPQPRKNAEFGWFWTALLGGFLGMIFALLVLAGINGSLDITHSQALIAVRADMENVSAKMESLQGDIRGLRQRLDSLEGLTARMEDAETHVEQLERELSELAAKATALQTEDKNLAGEIETMEDNLSILEKGVEKSHAFFTGMRELITKIFGKAATEGPSPDYAPSEEVSPVSTPTPTPNE